MKRSKYNSYPVLCILMVIGIFYQIPDLVIENSNGQIELEKLKNKSAMTGMIHIALMPDTNEDQDIQQVSAPDEYIDEDPEPNDSSDAAPDEPTRDPASEEILMPPPDEPITDDNSGN